MKYKKVIVIVGEKFKNCSKIKDVITIDEYLNTISKSQYFQDSVFMLGQGVSDSEINSLQKSKNNKTSRKQILKRASKEHTHKCKDENIVITDPVELGDTSFLSYLLIDDACAELSDHVTGFHVQGMVLIEAARQMMLAVSEKYILQDDSKGKSYCILNSINSQFLSFVFPIETEIELLIDTVEVKARSTSLLCTIKFTQNNKICAIINLESKFYDKDYMNERENLLANKAVEIQKQMESANPIEEVL